MVLFCINSKIKKSLISDRSHQQGGRKALKCEGTASSVKFLLVVPVHPLFSGVQVLQDVFGLLCSLPGVLSCFAG